MWDTTSTVILLKMWRVCDLFFFLPTWKPFGPCLWWWLRSGVRTPLSWKSEGFDPTTAHSNKTKLHKYIIISDSTYEKHSGTYSEVFISVRRNFVCLSAKSLRILRVCDLTLYCFLSVISRSARSPVENEWKSCSRICISWRALQQTSAELEKTLEQTSAELEKTLEQTSAELEKRRHWSKHQQS